MLKANREYYQAMVTAATVREVDRIKIFSAIYEARVRNNQVSIPTSWGGQS